MFIRNDSRSSGRGLLIAACAAVFFAAAPVGAALAHGGGHGGGHGHSHGDHVSGRMHVDPNDANNGGSWSSTDPRCWNGAMLFCNAGG